jgi:hypothetical protein
MCLLGAAQLSVEELERTLAWLGEELVRQVPDGYRAFVAGLMEEYARRGPTS